YAEFLWSEHVGEGTAQENADYLYSLHPADDPFWTVLPGDPGAANQFDGAVYDRGAMAVHALRAEIGDEAFFGLLKE
ncbi:M1 family peptidase, partial [Saccharothrix sp. MB29]|nr:M1 family peptidase [Saccharothrix sp. MB29]